MEENKKKRKEEPNKIRILWYLWRGKVIIYDDDGNSRIMQDFTSWLFSFFAWVLLIGVFLIFSATVYACIVVVDWSPKKIFGNIAGLFLIAVLLIFCIVVSFVLKVMSYDIKREKDRHYIIALFSGLISFVSLIISLIALFKGWI